MSQFRPFDPRSIGSTDFGGNGDQGNSNSGEPDANAAADEDESEDTDIALAPLAKVVERLDLYGDFDGRNLMLGSSREYDP